MAEYYSVNLSREVMKGLKENALQCIGVYTYNRKQWVIENGTKKNILHSNDEIIRIENGVPSIIDKSTLYSAGEILKSRLHRSFGVTKAKETYLLSGNCSAVNAEDTCGASYILFMNVLTEGKGK